MKVIILAGGLGSRLGVASESIPKPMIKIGDKPILLHIMKIYSHFGFNDFIICLGYKGNIIKDYFYNYKINSSDFTVDLNKDKVIFHDSHNEDWKVTLVDTGDQTLKGGRIKRIEKYLDDDVNMLTYGDGVSNINMKDLLDFHNSHNRYVTVTGVRPPSMFGEIIENNGEVTLFEEKPQTSKGLINGGFMVFDREMLDYLSSDEDCDFEFGPLHQLVDQNQVMTYKHNGLWECADTIRDVVHLNNLWNKNKAFWKVW